MGAGVLKTNPGLSERIPAEAETQERRPDIQDVFYVYFNLITLLTRASRSGSNVQKI